MITIGNVKIWMKCVHTFETGRHKRQADITLLFQYTFFNPGDEIYVIFRQKLVFFSFGILYNLKVQKKFEFLTSSHDVIYLWSLCIMCPSPNTDGELEIRKKFI